MSKKGENIYKRKDGRWEGRYIKYHTLDGRAKYGYVYGKTYREVRADLVCKKNLVYLPQEEPERRAADSFREAADTWLCSVCPQIKESTEARYRNLLRTYLLPVWGNMALREISYERLELYCRDLRLSGGVRGKGLSPKSVSDILTLMREILRHASDRGIPVACDGRAIHMKQADSEMRVLSRSEQDTLCRYLCQNGSRKNLGILVCLFTGLRVGELCALRWEDISLQERTIHVRQTMQRIQVQESPGQRTKIIVTPPKSQCSLRDIPLPENLAVLLEEVSSRREGYFLTDSEQKIVEPRTMQNQFQRVLKKCGIEKVNFHALRHTFATRCVELGFDVKSLSEILGHANVNITMNRYVHPSMELKRQNMAKISSLCAVK